MPKSPESEPADDSKARITAIYTDIGRGHPNYLDSVLRFLQQHHADVFQQTRITSIFQVAHGMSARAWKLVRQMYRLGSRGGLTASLYSSFRTARSRYDSNSHLVRLLARDLRARLAVYGGICLVAHPLLAQMLKDQNRVFYLHGEIAAPPESAVSGCERIYVPLPETKAELASAGVSASSLVETGLVLEPEMIRDLATTVQQRIRRIVSDQPLTVGFFISGAYPRLHVRLMYHGARSCCQAGMRVRMFWGSERREVRRLLTEVSRLKDDAGEICLDQASGPPELERRLVVVTGATREQETLRSLQYLPQLDLFCAAPHERVNWAVGAGLPQAMITPPIGTFAPENLDYVLRAGCGFELRDSESFWNLPALLSAKREMGELSQMVKQGWGQRAIDGAGKVVEDLLWSR